MSPRHRRRRFPLASVIRASLATLLVVLLVGALAMAAALLLFDPAAYRQDIEAAVLRATGRSLVLNGTMRLGFGLPPRLIIEDVTFANPAGATRPQMLTLDRVEARVAFWPLLTGHVDLTDLTLIHPDIILERDANGRGNWLMAPVERAPTAASSSADSGGTPAAPRPAGPPPISVQAIHMRQGRIGWRLTPGAPLVEALLPRLDAVASGPGGTMLLSGEIRSAGRALQLSGEIGSMDRLFDRAAVLPWPIQLSLHDSAAHLSITGSVARPLRGKGVSLLVDAGATDFTGIEAFLPGGLSVPQEASMTLRWGDGGIDSQVGLAGLNLHLGGVSLPRLLPGIDIRHIDVAAPGLDRPVHADLAAISPTLGPLRLVFNAGLLSGLLPIMRPDNPLPIDVTLDAGRALFSAKGLVAAPFARRGADLDVFVRLPDLAALGDLLGRSLPPLHEMAFQAHLSGDLNGVGDLGIHNATLTLRQAEFAGDVDLHPGVRPSLRAALTAQRVDLDSLLSDLSILWRKDAQDGRKESPAESLAGPDAVLPPATPSPPAVAPARWLIPDTPLDFAPLDRFDADVDFRFDSVLAGGVNASQVGGHLALHDGKLALERLAATMPGGPAEASLMLDARAAEAPISLSVHAPSLQLGQLSPALSAHALLTGSAALFADLRGAGHSPHAIAASLDGHFGVGATEIEVDNDLLLMLLRRARLPEIPLSATGSTRLRCVVADLALAKGMATVDALVLDLNRLAVLGGGTADLRDEQLALQLRPSLRLGGANAGGIVVPVRLGGSFLDPKASIGVADKGGAALTGLGLVDPCPAALAVVNGAAGAGEAKAAPPPPAKQKPPSPLDVLKELLK